VFLIFLHLLLHFGDNFLPSILLGDLLGKILLVSSLEAALGLMMLKLTL